MQSAAAQPRHAKRLGWARLGRNLGVAAYLGLAACTGKPEQEPETDAQAPDAPRCAAPSGVSASPANVGELVDLANGLLAKRNSEPLALSCLLESLDRPLGMLTVNSTDSLQPAFGVQSPRVLLFTGNLAVTVALGKGRELLEVGEPTSETRSIKAELGFPLAATLAASSPYERVSSAGGTVCAACHHDELRAAEPASALAYESDILRPFPRQEVPLELVEAEARSCDASVDAERCALLHALFDHGEVRLQRFSERAKTFGQ